jgi:hypothetical protein
MSLLEEQHSFYRERVPAQFNQTLALQVELASQEETARHMLEEMRAVRTAIRVEVECDAGLRIHRLEIERGRMRAVETTARPPFFILQHRLEAFLNLRRECDTSILGFLGVMAGLEAEMKLTRQRVSSLRALKGSLQLEIEGPQGFALVASFGVDPPEPQPRAEVRLSSEIFEALRNGVLDVQEAFLDERIEVAGDLELAIGVAIAAASPD